MATDDDRHLETYDNTKLSAFNTCPTYGVVRYAHHKRFPTTSRAMALEAGVVMHEVFQFVRLVTLSSQLYEMGKDEDFISNMMMFHGERLFGVERWQQIVEQSPATEDNITRIKHDVLIVLETSGYYDDPYDKRRTMSNLEECALAYVDRWNWKPPVWMRDYNDPCSDVGIELAFDLVVEINSIPSFRFTGKVDGIRMYGDKLRIEDNKTAARLNDAWEMSFETSHQMTGYCVAASLFTEQEVRSAEAIGLAIPMPRSEFTGFVRAVVDRNDAQFEKWVQWLLYTVKGYQMYTPIPEQAPMFTHSCNRYFRPCAFIPFCVVSNDERKDMLEHDMEVEEWSPLHKLDNTEE